MTASSGLICVFTTVKSDNAQRAGYEGHKAMLLSHVIRDLYACVQNLVRIRIGKCALNRHKKAAAWPLFCASGAYWLIAILPAESSRYGKERKAGICCAPRC